MQEMGPEYCVIITGHLAQPITSPVLLARDDTLHARLNKGVSI